LLERGITMTISDFEIQAYVDGELAMEERIAVQNEMAASRELADHVRALRSLKQLCRSAYSTASIPQIQAS